MINDTTNVPTQEIPYGFCHCGCGHLAPLAKMTNNKIGNIKGKPVRFINGHQQKRFEITFEEAFWHHVIPTEEGCCWEWQGAKNRAGYGNMRYRDHSYSAHRIAWELKHGPIPDGLIVMHSCDNPSCVNVAHLSLGTHKDNAWDKVRKGRAPRNTSHVNTKITDEQVAEARQKHFQENIPVKVLAEKYGIRWTTMNGIIFRQARKAVP